ALLVGDPCGEAEGGEGEHRGPCPGELGRRRLGAAASWEQRVGQEQHDHHDVKTDPPGPGRAADHVSMLQDGRGDGCGGRFPRGCVGSWFPGLKRETWGTPEFGRCKRGNSRSSAAPRMTDRKAKARTTAGARATG